jgi:3-oxoacyl-[acyl-carrier protein] reductase
MSTSAARLTRLSRSIAGRRAVVTGAGSGMGRATAHLFADEGARVAVVDRDADRVRFVVGEITEVHGPSRVMGVVVDLADAAAAAQVANDVMSTWGGVDILVNNAGVSVPARLDDDQFDDIWQFTLEVNVTAQARLLRACLPGLLQADGGGRVVNIASTEALVATASLSAYAASKSAVIGFTRSAAVELGTRGVTVNCICPGPIDTAMTAPIPGEAKATYARRRVALRRYGDPEEVAHLTLSLCLPSARFVTGATLAVDGGLSIRHT